ncbi:group III truncated hemoglobin [Woodsholea maritima]|uniref:group III truncated hemoglobin n=1 Tax=Woodsholea maritima TaxID=240237 RepID=UPI000363030B|nr:group III truncated hemoglobin [Woodsholea maritima]
MPTHPHALAARHAQRQACEAMGIDHAFIAQLVDDFYTRIRADQELGPIFDAVIGDQWGPHLDTMKTFWAAIALQTGEYSGRPMPAHVKIKTIRPEHFPQWLALFEATLDDIAPNPETKAFFLERAQRIAHSFQSHMFYDPAKVYSA